MSYLGAEGYCMAPLNVLLECRWVLYSVTECPTRVQKGIVWRTYMSCLGAEGYCIAPLNVLLGRRRVLYIALKCSTWVQNGICMAPLNVLLGRRRVLYCALNVLLGRRRVLYCALNVLFGRRRVLYCALNVLFGRRRVLYCAPECPTRVYLWRHWMSYIDTGAYCQFCLLRFPAYAGGYLVFGFWRSRVSHLLRGSSQMFYLSEGWYCALHNTLVRLLGVGWYYVAPWFYLGVGGHCVFCVIANLLRGRQVRIVCHP